MILNPSLRRAPTLLVGLIVLTLSGLSASELPEPTVAAEPSQSPTILDVEQRSDEPTRRQSRSWFRLGGEDRLEWTGQERGLAWSFVTLSTVDAYQTMNIPEGSAEANPLLSGLAGDHPGAAETLLFKTATTYGALKLTSRLKSRKARRWVLVSLNVLQLAVALQNERVTGGIVF